MCCVAPSEDSESDESVPSEHPIDHMRAPGEYIIHSSNTYIITLTLHVDMAGPSAPPYETQSSAVVMQGSYTSQGKRKIKVTEKARYVFHVTLSVYV